MSEQGEGYRVPVPPLSSARELRAWMQDIEDRVSRLEGRRSVVIGGWVLAEQAGAVVASNASTGQTVQLAP